MISHSTSRAVSAQASDERFEANLRPRDWSGYIGQEKVKSNLRVAIEAARRRHEPLEHILLSGPPGLGKTTLAHIIARETGAEITVTSGPALEKAGDLASILTGLENGNVLFIDEIHRISKVVAEILYPAMEDFAIDLVLGKGPSAKTLRLDIPHCTIIGATTRVGLLPAPLRDRFGMHFHLDFYTPEDIEKIIQQSAKILKEKVAPEAAKLLAHSARRTPRIANRLLKRARDYASVESGKSDLTAAVAKETLQALEIDEIGLDPADRKILLAIIENYRGGPVGASTLAAATAEELDMIEDVIEPYLLRIGFLERTPRGRKATEKAYQHLRISPSQTQKAFLK